MATQPQQLKNGLGPQVEAARRSLPDGRPSQDEFYDLCNARFYLLSKRDSFKDQRRMVEAIGEIDYRGFTSAPAMPILSQ